jgi:hypothetical protein
MGGCVVDVFQATASNAAKASSSLWDQFNTEKTQIDTIAFCFVKKCLQRIGRGLQMDSLA